MNIHDTFNSSPNCTILVPGACNAKCGFCFWNHADGKFAPGTRQYMAKLQNVLGNLPEKYQSLSLSGGEPTKSRYIGDILTAIQPFRRQFKRVVLTTNGAGLDAMFDRAFPSGQVDFVNISRHHFDEDKNAAVFGGAKLVPNNVQLTSAVRTLRCAGVPVTLNCVIDDTADPLFIIKMAHFARDINAVAVSFRKQAGTVAPTPAELWFEEKFGHGEKNNCPVCRSHVQRWDGVDIRWKGSVVEPSIACGKTYEAVFHPDGKTYADWGRKHELKTGLLTAREQVCADRVLSPQVAQREEDMSEKFTRLLQENNRLRERNSVPGSCGSLHGGCGAALATRVPSGCGGSSGC